MAAVARLIALFLLFAVGGAWAYSSVPPEMVASYTCVNKTGRSPAEACAAYISASYPFWQAGTVTGQQYLKTATLGACTASACQMKVDSATYQDGKPTGGGGSSGWYSQPVVNNGVTKGCKQGATLIGDKCQCNTGLKPGSATECQPYSCPAPGNYTSMTQPDQEVKNAGDGICQAGCSYTPSSWKGGQDGKIWAAWPFKATGKACDGDKGSDNITTGEQNTSKPAPIPCGANQCPGTATYNGTTTQMCVACKGTTAPPKTESASAPAGAASGTGDTTKTTQTTCDGISCTTTTTTRDGSGTVTGSEKTEQPQESFCTENPQSPMCKQSAFGGSCAATSCEGDAVQCALAQEVIKRNCQWYDDEGKTKRQQDTGNAAMAAGNQPDWHPAKHAEETSLAGSISQVDLLGGGSCPSDQVVNGPFGQTLVVPFSRICDPASILGNALVGVAMLIAAFIMFRN